MKTKNFLVWLAITCVYVMVMIVVENCFSLLSYLAAQDTTFICYGIFSLTAAAVLLCLRQVVNKNFHMKKMKDLSQIAMTLGLLGTVAGLYMSFSALDLADANSKQLLTKGLSAALTTTIIGILSSLVIYTYVIFLREDD